MQVNNNTSNMYYTPYQTNKNVKAFSGFSINDGGNLEINETSDNAPGFANFVDYQEFHKAWMSQGATTPFSYTQNEGYNSEKNSISLVPGMMTRLSNGFKLSINNYMVEALGNFKNNEAAKESTAIASAMSSLIKVANGQIPISMFHSSRTQNNSEYAKKGLEAFGIDTSKAFTINDKTFHFDQEGQIRLGNK